jgi:hypothetical protein
LILRFEPAIERLLTLGDLRKLSSF